jgi:hypothetical protein
VWPRSEDTSRRDDLARHGEEESRLLCPSHARIFCRLALMTPPRFRPLSQGYRIFSERMTRLYVSEMPRFL